MEPSSIELKLISCKDLQSFNFFQKLTIYATVSIDSDDPKRELKKEQKQQQRTQTHRDCDGDGANPEWNHETRFDLGWVSHALLEDSSADDLFLQFEFRHEGVILGDKLIGESRVRLADLVRDAGSVDDVARFVSYEVRSGDGKPNGIFNFSYKLKGFFGKWSETHAPQILEGRISGYPVLAPEDCDPNQSLLHYPPPPKIENACCYPTVDFVTEGLLPPSFTAATVSSPTCGEYGCFYPPPPSPPPRPYPYQYQYPYPPPPPPPEEHGMQFYPPFGPGGQAHPWPSGPSFRHPW